MKKMIYLAIVSVMLIFASCTTAQGQSTPWAPATMTASSATNTNAVATTHTATLTGETNNFETVTIQVVGTKVSGTPSGSVKIYGSLDGTNYVNIQSSTSDSLAITNTATQAKIWTFTHTYYKYYRAVVTTTGTQVSTWSAILLGRKNSTPLLNR